MPMDKGYYPATVETNGRKTTPAPRKTGKKPKGKQ